MRPIALISAGIAALLLAACAPAADAPHTHDDHAAHEHEHEGHEHSDGEDSHEHDHGTDETAQTDYGPAEGTVALFEGAVFIPPGERDVTAAFGTFVAGARAVELIAAKADFAEAVEFHTHEAGEDGKMAMRKVESFAIPANGQHVLKRGSDHMMLFGVDRAALELGAELSITVTARFEDGSTEEITLPLTVQDL